MAETASLRSAGAARGPRSARQVRRESLAPLGRCRRSLTLAQVKGLGFASPRAGPRSARRVRARLRLAGAGARLRLAQVRSVRLRRAQVRGARFALAGSVGRLGVLS